jgi:hypothetical protein
MVATYTGKRDFFAADKPRPWTGKQFRPGAAIQFDPAPDGKRLVVAAAPETGPQEPAAHVTVLLNFFDELRRKAPGK